MEEVVEHLFHMTRALNTLIAERNERLPDTSDNK